MLCGHREEGIRTLAITSLFSLPDGVGAREESADPKERWGIIFSRIHNVAAVGS